MILTDALFSIQNTLDEHSLDTEFAQSVLSRACHLAAITQSVCVRIVDNSEIRSLNLEYRSVDAETDVLTFPSGMLAPFPAGDIAISAPYAQRQAQLRGVSLDNEIAALIIHGVLHLAGYDDETEGDQKEMQQAMKAVGEQLQIPIDAEWTSVLHNETS